MMTSHETCQLQEGLHAEVDAYLRRRHGAIIREIELVQKEDLDLKTHLSGLKRTLLKVCLSQSCADLCHLLLCMS